MHTDIHYFDAPFPDAFPFGPCLPPLLCPSFPLTLDCPVHFAFAGPFALKLLSCISLHLRSCPSTECLLPRSAKTLCRFSHCGVAFAFPVPFCLASSLYFSFAFCRCLCLSSLLRSSQQLAFILLMSFWQPIGLLSCRICPFICSCFPNMCWRRPYVR